MATLQRILFQMRGLRRPILQSSVELRTDKRFVMNAGSRGVKGWECAETEGKGRGLDIGVLSNKVIDNVERCGYSKASDLNKVFDNVRTVRDLDQAEKALLSFRKGYNPCRLSTPRVVVRACIRVGRPNRALHFIKHKVQYGIFPSVNTYNVLMDAFLAEKNYRAIVKTYEEMIKSELIPNPLSYHLAVFGYMLQEDSGEDSLKLVKELCEQCIMKNRRIGLRAYHILLRILRDKEDTENSRQVLLKLDSDFPLYNSFDVNWRVRGFMYIGMLDKCFEVMDLVIKDPVLTMSEEVFKAMEEHLKEGEDVSIHNMTTLKDYREKLESARKLL